MFSFFSVFRGSPNFYRPVCKSRTLRKHSTVTQDNAQELCAARRDLSCRGHAAQCAASVVRKGWDFVARSHRLAPTRSDLLVAILHAREPETESNDPVDAMHVCLVETTTCASRRSIGRHVRHPLMVGEGRMRDPKCVRWEGTWVRETRGKER